MPTKLHIDTYIGWENIGDVSAHICASHEVTSNNYVTKNSVHTPYKTPFMLLACINQQMWLLYRTYRSQCPPIGPYMS